MSLKILKVDENTYYQLYICCPVCRDQGRDSPPSFWKHGDNQCFGDIYVGYDGDDLWGGDFWFICQKCGCRAHVKDWGWACPGHSNHPDEIVGASIPYHASAQSIMAELPEIERVLSHWRSRLLTTTFFSGEMTMDTKEMISEVNLGEDAYHRNAHVLADLFDDAPMWGLSSMGGLEAPIGWDDHDMPVMLRFSAETPHALMGGNTGSGKSNLIHVIIGSLCCRYSPEELQIRFLDMKDGIETFRYVDKATGKAWLSHLKLSVSENPENPAEVFLDEIISEIHKRNSEFKCEGVASFPEFRKKTGKKMSRILVVIEGFSQIFWEYDSSSRESEILQTLQMMLALGHSCGIHVMLSAQLMSQNDRPILDRMPVRLALPGASGVLANGNDSDKYLRLNHCIINEFSGERGKNNVFAHPLCDLKLLRAKIDGFHEKG